MAQDLRTVTLHEGGHTGLIRGVIWVRAVWFRYAIAVWGPKLEQHDVNNDLFGIICRLSSTPNHFFSKFRNMPNLQNAETVDPRRSFVLKVLAKPEAKEGKRRATEDETGDGRPPTTNVVSLSPFSLQRNTTGMEWQPH